MPTQSPTWNRRPDRIAVYLGERWIRPATGRPNQRPTKTTGMMAAKRVGHGQKTALLVTTEDDPVIGNRPGQERGGPRSQHQAGLVQDALGVVELAEAIGEGQ